MELTKNEKCDTKEKFIATSLSIGERFSYRKGKEKRKKKVRSGFEPETFCV